MAGVTDLISPFALVPLGCCHWGGIGLPVGVTPAVAAYEGDADMMYVCVSLCASVIVFFAKGSSVATHRDETATRLQI